jgi:hypothetical protein
MFYPGSGHLLIPDHGSGSKQFFIPDPRSYMQSGMQTYFFLASYAFRSKVLALLIVKKIRDQEKIHPGSQGVKSTGSRIRIRITGFNPTKN